MANTGSGFNNRYGGVLYDGLDQHAASAGDYHIQKAVQPQHLVDGGPVAAGDQLNRVRGNGGCSQSPMDHFDDFFIRA
ncbi:hypothetical protein D3C73_1616810 [compost metagenome]